MRKFMAESEVEEVCLEYLLGLGWATLYGPDLGPGQHAAERSSYKDPLLEGRLCSAIARLNPGLKPTEVEAVIATVRRPESADLLMESWRVYRLMVQGVPLEKRLDNGETRTVPVQVVDWDDPKRNDFLAVNQFTVQGEKRDRRPDVVCFLNGLPIAIFELKVPGDENATVYGAREQLDTYEHEIPQLMIFPAVSVISTGTDARMGTTALPFDKFIPWKTIDGKGLAPKQYPQIRVLVQGVFEPARFLDLVRNFVAFTEIRGKLTKRVAKYQQFHAVNKAVEAVLAAKARGDGKGGVVWHTQGSGKSLEILWFSSKCLRSLDLANPTVVLLTDRDNLDDQLYQEFASTYNLPETPVQAEGREQLRKILSNRASGGIVFSTLQKFGRSQEERLANQWFPCLSPRSNIIVVADEAHRSHYDNVDGLARNLHDALPNAVRVGFSGTPIEERDRDTRDVFGDYIDIYDITQSIEDGTTVRIFYEPRLARVKLPDTIAAQIDDDFIEATEGMEDEARQRSKYRWARVEAVVGAQERLQEVAKDIIEHWEGRRASLLGKALIVCMSRRICVDLYNEIVKLRPSWHSTDDEKGVIKCVITGAASEGHEINQHVRNRDHLRKLEDRAKDPDDPLELVIVRDMWLAGFDSPPLHTMYVDKPMQGAGLMQAIARINRTFRDKPSGLVVDYIGVAESLRAALASYTDRDREAKEVGALSEEGLYALQEHIEICRERLWGCAWREALESAAHDARLQALTETENHLLEGTKESRELFIASARKAGQAWTLCTSNPKALEFRDDLSFFQAVAEDLRKGSGSGASVDQIREQAIRQVVSDAVGAAGMIDIYQQAGLAKPDISILDDEFLKRFRAEPVPSLQALRIELIRRILDTAVRKVGKRNLVAERRFSEMLAQAINAYENRTLTAAEVVAALVELAKQMKQEADRGAKLGLKEDELAFYDAVRQNDSAVMEMGDEVLKQIAEELVLLVRQSATVDWDKKEQVRALLRRSVRRLLTKYHYPPDQQESAIDLVVEQAERVARASLEGGDG
jgi:type I restriction enzyme R subunit